jgi:hypothetical protein
MSLSSPDPGTGRHLNLVLHLPARPPAAWQMPPHLLRGLCNVDSLGSRPTRRCASVHELPQRRARLGAEHPENMAEEPRCHHEGLPDVLPGQRALLGLVQSHVATVLAISPVSLHGRRDRPPRPRGNSAIDGPRRSRPSCSPGR